MAAGYEDPAALNSTGAAVLSGQSAQQSAMAPSAAQADLVPQIEDRLARRLWAKGAK